MHKVPGPDPAPGSSGADPRRPAGFRTDEERALVGRYEHITRKNVATLVRAIGRRPSFTPPSDVAATAGELQQLHDPAALIWMDLFRLAFYTQSRVITVRRRGRQIAVSYPAAPADVTPVVLPLRIFPRLTICLINYLEDHITRNGELEIEGWVRLRWGMCGNLRDYRLDVRLWLDGDWPAARILISRDDLPQYDEPTSGPSGGALQPLPAARQQPLAEQRRGG